MKPARRVKLLGLIAAVVVAVLLLVSAMPSTAATSVFINEIHYDNAGADTGEGVEVAGPAGTDLSGWSIALYNGSSSQRSVYDTINLNGVIPDQSNGFGTLAFFRAGIQNGSPDGLALVDPNGNVIQFLSYEGSFTAADGPAVGMTSTDSGVSEPKDTPEGESLQLAGTGTTYEDFHWTGPVANTFGAINADQTFGEPEPIDPCTEPATPIHDIQGDGDSSPVVGTTQVIQGVVVGDYQDGLRGYFVQEEDDQVDADPMTSEGLFVYDNHSDVNVGDVVRVQGKVKEYHGLTELSNVSEVTVCGTGASVTPATVTLPLPAVSDWEYTEGMLVTIPQQLVVTSNYTLGRYGEVELSVNHRLYNPTDITSPGPSAIAQQDLNDRSRIQLDDGSSAQNPQPLPPYLGPDGTLRAGDTIPSLTGVLNYSYGAYEIEPVGDITFTRVNNRQPTPSPVGGEMVVAGMNLHNYFVTIDTGDPICGPNADQGCRGADSPEELQRQRDKIVSAIQSMNADVIGLVELENHPTDAALQDLVNALNAAAGADVYDMIATGPIGSDVIKVGLIYKPARVTPVGDFAILDSSVDPNFIDSKNRPVLAQTFRQNSDNALFTVAVNHLKSKGSDCNDVGDPDTGDGQGNCNLTRTKAANAEVNWLAGDPTGSGDPDFILVGDFNAYAMEDPITAFKNGGYVDLVDNFLGQDAYTYSYKGQFGSLDYALADANLTGQVSGVTVWHINADEPSALDYNDYNQPALYHPDPYRSSDHDPVLVGLDLNGPPVCTAATPSVETIWPPNVITFTPVNILNVTDPEGDPITITIDSIFQDEPVDAPGHRSFTPDGRGVGTDTAEVRAEREGRGNGRVYHIRFTADDGHSNTCSGEVLVKVPKVQRLPAVDDGALYDSTVE